MNKPDTSRPTVGETATIKDESPKPKKRPPPPPGPPLRRTPLNKIFTVGQAANIDGIPVIVRKVTAKEIVFRSVAVPPGFKVQAPE